MQLNRFKLLLILCFVSTIGISNLQASRPDTLKLPLFESLNDSIDLANGFYNRYDSLIANRFPAAHIYDNWNTNKVAYQKLDSILNKADSLFLKDTTFILLSKNDTTSWSHPFDGRVTSRFGGRRGRFHYGIDVDLQTGDSVRCAFDGMVRMTKYFRGYGKVIVVRHYNGLETVYGHMSKFLVDSNSIVKAGQVIGLGGNTGRSTGSHLHFETRYLGAAINPEWVFDFKKFELKNDTLMLTKKKFGYLVELREIKNAKYHTIRSGDTLGAIARRYGTSISALCAMNGIRRTTILRIGKRLRVR